MLPLGGQGQEDAIAILKRNKHEIRRAVSKQMTLKYAPDFRFLLDETFDRMDETRRLFAKDDVARDIAASDDAQDDDTPPQD